MAELILDINTQELKDMPNFLFTGFHATKIFLTGHMTFQNKKDII